jgi:putative membrane protein
MLRVALASAHLLALAIGMMAAVLRGSALREPASLASLRRGLRMDLIWGIAAVLWVVTGLWRLLGATEKPTAYYMANMWFHAKMGLFVLIVLLEIYPMLTLIKWRMLLGKGAEPSSFMSVTVGKRIALIGHVQATLALGMIIAATAMARGFS